MQIGEINEIQNLLRPLGYGICAGILFVFFVLALAFLAVFDNPMMLAKNVLGGVMTYFSGSIAISG